MAHDSSYGAGGASSSGGTSAPEIKEPKDNDMEQGDTGSGGTPSTDGNQEVRFTDSQYSSMSIVHTIVGWGLSLLHLPINHVPF